MLLNELLILTPFTPKQNLQLTFASPWETNFISVKFAKKRLHEILNTLIDRFVPVRKLTKPAYLYFKCNIYDKKFLTLNLWCTQFVNIFNHQRQITVESSFEFAKYLTHNHDISAERHTPTVAVTNESFFQFALPSKDELVELMNAHVSS